MTEPEPAGLRIGDAERRAAMAPEPRPQQLAGDALPATDPPPPPSGAVATGPERGPGALARWGPRVSAVMPRLAVILFFAVPIAHPWVFFLLIPLAGALFAGSRDDRDDRPRDRDRD